MRTDKSLDDLKTLPLDYTQKRQLMKSSSHVVDQEEHLGRDQNHSFFSKVLQWFGIAGSWLRSRPTSEDISPERSDLHAQESIRFDATQAVACRRALLKARKQFLDIYDV